MFPATTEKVRMNTPPEINAQIQARTQSELATYSKQSREHMTERIFQLNREWDTERVLEANASGLIVLTVLLGFTRSKVWFFASGTMAAFLLQHALEGWCPPLHLIRRLGVRTAKEIHDEITALKLLRGDFGVIKSPSAIVQKP